MPQLVLLKIREKGGVLALTRLQGSAGHRANLLPEPAPGREKSKPIDGESFVLRLNNNVFE